MFDFLFKAKSGDAGESYFDIINADLKKCALSKIAINKAVEIIAKAVAKSDIKIYDANGNNIYESSNYTTQAYCERAINRFKSHAIIGTYTIEAADGKFFFVLKRKTYVHKGSPQNTFEEANSHMREIKNFAQTDIVRVQ